MRTSKPGLATPMSRGISTGKGSGSFGSVTATVNHRYYSYPRGRSCTPARGSSSSLTLHAMPLSLPSTPGGTAAPTDLKKFMPTIGGDWPTMPWRSLMLLGSTRAAVVSWCGSSEEVILAVEHPERVTQLIEIAPNLLLTMDPERAAGLFVRRRTRYRRRLGQDQPPLLVA